MGKIGRLVRGLTHRAFLIAVGGTFAALLGLASAILTISGRHFELRTSAALISASLLLAGMIHFRKLTVSQIAVDDVLERGHFENPSTRVRCPCDIGLAKAAKQLALDCFSSSVTIEPDTFEQFRVKNPNILACLTSESGNFLGYFDVIPIVERFAEPFLRGQVSEEDLTHEDVLNATEMKICKYIFISGLAVLKPHTHAGKRNASIMTWALLRYIERYYAGASPLAFAVAATPSGNEILDRFGIDLRSGGEGRRDGYRLYTITVSKQAIRRRLACLPDWSNSCKLDWEEETIVRDPSDRPSLPKMRAWRLGDASP